MLHGAGKNELFVNINDRATMAHESDSNSNSVQFLRRHVRDQWKELIRDFKHAAADATGDMEPQTMRDILYRHNILIANEQFAQLVKDMDEDGDGRISYTGHLSVPPSFSRSLSFSLCFSDCLLHRIHEVLWQGSS